MVGGGRGARGFSAVLGVDRQTTVVEGPGREQSGGETGAALQPLFNPLPKHGPSDFVMGPGLSRGGPPRLFDRPCNQKDRGLGPGNKAPGARDGGKFGP